MKRVQSSRLNVEEEAVLCTAPPSVIAAELDAPVHRQLEPGRAQISNFFSAESKAKQNCCQHHRAITLLTTVNWQ